MENYCNCPILPHGKQHSKTSISFVPPLTKSFLITLKASQDLSVFLEKSCIFYCFLSTCKGVYDLKALL